MNQMNRIESKLDQVLEQLAKLTGQQPSTGVTADTKSGVVFMPGTGALGSSHPDKPQPGPIPDSEDERRRIVEAARANLKPTTKSTEAQPS